MTEDRPELPDSLISPNERARVLSATRLKVSLSLAMLLLTASLVALMFVLVSSIFAATDSRTRTDLTWKARRGVVELSRTLEYGMVLGDSAVITAAASDYLGDGDVGALVVQDSVGKSLLRHKGLPDELRGLFDSPAGAVVETDGFLASWGRSEIEGVVVGKVALVISKERLRTGAELKRKILYLGGAGLLSALLLALAYVNLYVGPLMRLTAVAFERLEKTTQQALEAVRIKSEFLANMSHEIRTPMNGVLGMAQLVLRSRTLDTKTRRHVETINSSANALLNIVNDVLDFSKLEAGKLNIHKDQFDLRSILQDIAELMAPRAEEKRVELSVDVAPSLPSVFVGDPDRIRQVATNLVSNAIKFTSHGDVVVRAELLNQEAHHGTVRVEVQDNGVGIAPEDRGKLFQSFSQVDGSSTRQHGGTGLGLVICKRLVELMGGEVGFQSEQGQGSSFWFELPLEVVQSIAPTKPTRMPRILIGEPNETIRGTLCAHLTHWGYLPVAVGSASEVLFEVQRASADGVTFAAYVFAAEVFAQGGAKLSSTLRNPEHPAAPVVVTAHSAQQTEVEADVRLTKPLRMSELYNALQEAFTPAAATSAPDVSEAQKSARGGPRGDRILIVEDNEVNQLVAGELLSEMGYEYQIAQNGAMAVEALKTGSFDAVLMDCQMPVMDGYEATRRIRKLDGEKSRVPIIALTAHALQGDRQKVLEAGMDAYLTKPLTEKALVQMLTRWLCKDGSVEKNTVQAAKGVLPVLAERARSSKLVEVFRRLMPDQVEAIGQAVIAADGAQTRDRAHKAKGSCLALGADQMAETCKRLQQLAEKRPFDAQAATELYQRLLGDFEALLVALATEGADLKRD